MYNLKYSIPENLSNSNVLKELLIRKKYGDLEKELKVLEEWTVNALYFKNFDFVENLIKIFKSFSTSCESEIDKLHAEMNTGTVEDTFEIEKIAGYQKQASFFLDIMNKFKEKMITPEIISKVSETEFAFYLLECLHEAESEKDKFLNFSELTELIPVENEKLNELLDILLDLKLIGKIKLPETEISYGLSIKAETLFSMYSHFKSFTNKLERIKRKEHRKVEG